MPFRELSPWEWKTEPIRLIGKEKMLLTACDGERLNSMTVGWGGFGVMWGLPAVYIAVRPTRYTYEILEMSDVCALSLLPASMSHVLTLCGKMSGRDGDKHKAAGITPIRMPCGIWGISEAELVITARTLYAAPMREEDFLRDELIGRWYAHEPYHTLYFAAIERIYQRE